MTKVEISWGAAGATLTLMACALLGASGCVRKATDARARSDGTSTSWDARVDTLRAQAKASGSVGLETLANALAAAQANADGVARADPVDALYAGLVARQPAFRKNVVLVFESRSPLPASLTSPRLITFSEDDGLVVSSAGSGEDVEFLEFDAARGAFRFHRLGLPGDTAGGSGHTGVATAVTDDPSCKKCHGKEGRPVWDAITGWPGAYGSLPSDGRILHTKASSDDPNALGGFLGQASHPVFKRKEWEALNAFVWTHEGGYRARPRYRHFDVGEVGGAANVAYLNLMGKNFDLGNVLTRLQGRAVLAALEASAKARGEASPEEVVEAFLYVAKLVAAPKGMPAPGELDRKPSRLGEAFERAYESDDATKARAAALKTQAAEIQARYEDDIFKRQEKIFTKTFGVDIPGGAAPSPRDVFRPLEQDGAPSAVERSVRLLTFLQGFDIDPRGLSTNAYTVEKDGRASLVSPDGGGVFRIGSMGDVFQAVCAAHVKKSVGASGCTDAVMPSGRR